MSMQISSEKTDFQLGTLTSFAPARVSDDTPFCIAVLGDFSGRGSRGQCEKGPALAARRRTAVDVDNLEGLPGKLGCEVHIPVGGKNGPRIAIRVSELDHFHPDQIYDRLEIFQELKATRERLRDPATFSDAASQVRSWLAGPENTEASKPVEAQSVPAQEEPDADTIERLLGRQPDRQHHSAPAGQSADIEGLIREIIQPYIVPAPHPQQAELISQVDQAISGQMRAILHHPDLQKIEAAWRTLHLLVSQVETDETLKIYAIDITKAELAADLASADQLQSAGTYRLLAEQSVGVQGTQPYALLVGGYRFDHTADDINLLCRLARAAQAAGAPLLAEADAHFAGCQSISATPDPDEWRWQAGPAAARLWQEFRRSSEAASVGLILPRVLLRLPYGKDTEPVERFDFEEFSPLAGHRQYLWGNPAAVCACLLAKAFGESGWSLTGVLGRDFGGMPMHVYKSGGETCVTPCAETYLTERAMQVLIDKGLMPVLSIKGQDAVRIPRFQSIAEPPAPLAGRWR